MDSTPIDATNTTTPPSNVVPPMASPQPQKSNTGKIVAIVVIVILLILAIPIIIFVLIFAGIFNFAKNIESDMDSGTKLVCTNGNSSVTVYYNNDRITGLTNRGSKFDYEIDDIKDRVGDYYSIEEGLIAFGQGLENSSNGDTSCNINGIGVSNKTTPDAAPVETGPAGDGTTGYITIPDGWKKSTSSVGYIYSGESYLDVIKIDTIDLSKATNLQDAAQIYIDANIFVFEEDLHTTEAKIGTSKDIDALRVHYDSSVFPSAAYIFKTDTGYHVISFETDDEDNLTIVEQVIYTYRTKLDASEQTNVDNQTNTDDTSSTDKTTDSTESNI